jgi:GNAT superfamily N-acetyltransferase
MRIISYFESENKAALVEKLAKVDWSAAKFLVALLREDRFYEMLGGWGDIYLLMDGENIVSFATLTGQDSVRDEAMVPWSGFVYTAPEYRGHRYSGQLLRHIEAVASQKGYHKLYISTDHIGLYEKYGYVFLENRRDYWGDDTRVLCKTLQPSGLLD